MTKTNKFSAEIRARTVRMLLEHECEHPSPWAAAISISGKTGCSPDTLVNQAKRAGMNGL